MRLLIARLVAILLNWGRPVSVKPPRRVYEILITVAVDERGMDGQLLEGKFYNTFWRMLMEDKADDYGLTLTQNSSLAHLTIFLSVAHQPLVETTSPMHQVSYRVVSSGGALVGEGVANSASSQETAIHGALAQICQKISQYRPKIEEVHESESIIRPGRDFAR